MNGSKELTIKESVALGLKARSMSFPKIFGRPFKKNNPELSNPATISTSNPIPSSLSSSSSSSSCSSSSIQESQGIPSNSDSTGKKHGGIEDSNNNIDQKNVTSKTTENLVMSQVIDESNNVENVTKYHKFKNIFSSNNTSTSFTITTTSGGHLDENRESTKNAKLESEQSRTGLSISSRLKSRLYSFHYFNK